jgi:hypothetical protein
MFRGSNVQIEVWVVLHGHSVHANVHAYLDRVSKLMSKLKTGYVVDDND